MDKKLIFCFDVETGGTNPETSSLLSVGYHMVYDNKVLHSREVFIKEEPLMLTEEAMNINKITLDQIWTNGVSNYQLYNHIISDWRMCNRYIQTMNDITYPGNLCTDKMIPMGHNVQFDLSFLKHAWKHGYNRHRDCIGHSNFKNNNYAVFVHPEHQHAQSFNEVFDYHHIDTYSILKMMSDSGILEGMKKVSLNDAAEHFGIDNAEHHNALNDATVTLEIYRKCQNLVKSAVDFSEKVRNLTPKP